MVKRAGITDAAALAELAHELWSGHSPDDLESEFEKLTGDPDAACFITYMDGNPVAFAQCQLRRDYVEGTSSSPVGYLEGIFVLDAYRHLGIAGELLSYCEKWAEEKNCSEFASDCGLENEASLQFHLAMGFEEANRIVCFRKSLKTD